ncbi:hypothetical protein N7474_008089 [Penicillium riverlandense]|uniref:uncharacterized protein n=1 Tax=Penicillium riverlandense TaxID=1903569 RepID=UPI00254705AB|nr:uncharacterized protein N7474_008089 [Penicillium riverlandense]KAJ5811788.1 hypothetical protein N7474_008089 [Penicillium riverlandense]
MAVDTDVVADASNLESEKQADDFIPLGGDEDFVAFAADEDEDEDEDPSYDKTFHPHRITLPTFRRLLACYATTAEQVYRRKMMVKLQPKPAKGSLAKLKKRAGSASATATGAALIQKTDFNASEQRYIQTETDKYLELDQLRYEGLPKKVAERKTGDDGDEKNGYLSKDELLSIMEWKMKHGVARPTLMGNLKTNQANLVRKSTAAALSALPIADPTLYPDEAFPRPSLDALTKPLRGVGPATASLILSISTAAGDASHQIPFYSDDVYLWLCLKDFPEPEDARTPQPLISSGGASTETKPKKKPSKYKRPNGELNVKYNASEYRQLWNASWELRERLNRSMDTSDQEDGEAEDDNAQPISHNDIEKVAFVLRNIAFSGFYQDQDPEAFLKARAAIEKANQPPPDDTPKRHKKKRKHDEKDGGSKGKGSRNSKRSKQN